MNIKTSELSGAALDWAVAKCENLEIHTLEKGMKISVRNGELEPWWVFTPSTNWAQGGPIIEREDINVTRYTRAEVTETNQEIYRKDGWTASTTATAYWITPIRNYGTTPLLAAMRCYVTSKLGEWVDMPEEVQA